MLLFSKLLIHNFIFLIIHLIIIKSEDNISDILVLSFKEYYHQTYNMLQNNTEYNSKDFINSFLFSKIYLEFEIGDNTSFDKGINQTLNTIVEAKTDSFILRHKSRNNYTICNFNSSLSKTFYSNMLSTSFCKSEDKLKIYTDTSFTNYKYVNFSFDNYFCLNDSICGEVGTDICIYKNSNKDFISKMDNILNNGNQNFAFHYSSINKNEGIFIFGDMPHNYFKNKYNENDLISFYTKTINFEIIMDTINFDGKEYYSPEEYEDKNYYDYINVEITPNTEGIEFDKYFFNVLIRIYFNDYINKNICKVETIDVMTTIIYCYADKFGKEDINKFPKIVFSKYKLNFNITFDKEDLFYYKENKYYLKIYSKIGTYKKFTLGRILLKKYLTVFNADKKQIYFYNTKLSENINEKENFMEKYGKIILISLLFGLIIFLFIGILIGKLIFKERKKHANEMDDDKYEYQSKKNNNVEPLYNQKEDEEK